MELDPAYVDVSVRRSEAFTRQKAVLAGQGATFAAVGLGRRGDAGRNGLLYQTPLVV